MELGEASGNAILRNISRVDDGIYVCVAENSRGQKTEKNTYVEVLRKCYISIECALGFDDLLLSCLITKTNGSTVRAKKVWFCGTKSFGGTFTIIQKFFITKLLFLSGR